MVPALSLLMIRQLNFGLGRFPRMNFGGDAHDSQEHPDWRDLCLDLSIASGVALVVATESLGALSWLSTLEVRAVWLAWLVVLEAGVLHQRTRIFSNVHQSGTSLARSSRIVLAGLGGIVMLVGVSALFAPPNSIDSLNYHMSRVVNWQERHSVAAYPAGYLPQLYQPPWAEFAILNLQIATGSDRLAGGVQWLCMLGSIILASSIARDLGASKKGQVLAAAFAGSLPTGILEASGALNDVVATFWLTAFVASVLQILSRPARGGWVGYAFAGAALGLALATKGTNYIYAVGFVVLLLGVSFRNLHPRHLPHLALAGALVISVNAGYFVRNYQLFGALLGPGVDEATGSSYVVDSITWNGFLSNLARNLELEIATPDPIFNAELFDRIEKFHEWLGIATDSPLTTWNGTAFKPVRLSFQESQSGNVLAVVGLVLTLVAASAGGQLRRNPRLSLHLCCWATGLVLFCLLLKWQPWNARLHLTWMVLGGPIVGAVWTRHIGRLAWIPLCAALAWLCIRWIVDGGALGARRVLAGGGALALMVVGGWIVSHRLRGTKRLLVSVTRARGYATRFAHAYWDALFGLALLAAGLPWALWNETRPVLGVYSVALVPRLQQYFVNAPELEAPYRWAAARIQQAGCSRVGLLAGPGSIDYPVWVLLRDGGRDVSIRDVQVPNVSARLAGSTFTPCAVLVLAPEVQNADLALAGQQFRRVLDPDKPESASPSVAVFLPSPSATRDTAAWAGAWLFEW